MPPIYLGSTPATKMYLGGTQLSAVCLGVQSLLGSAAPTINTAAFELTDYLLRGGGFTGATDSRYIAASFKFRPGLREGESTTTVANNGAGMEIVRSSTAKLRINRDTANRISITLSSGASVFTFRTTSSIVAADEAAHFAISADTNQAAGSKIGRILKNGVDETVEIVSDANAAFIADFTESDWAIGATTGGLNLLKATLAELMLWNTNVDWTTSISKVYSNGALVDPGADGSLVTGTAPLIYLSVRAGDLPSAFLTNRGSGGNFVQGSGTGAVTKRERGHFAWGDSFRGGSSATTIPGTDALYLTNRALSPVYAWRPRGFPGLGYADIEAGYNSRIATDMVGFEGIVSFEGGINNSAQTTLVSNLNASFVRMVNDFLGRKPAGKYLVIGMVTGDPVNEIPGTAVGDRIAAANALNASTFGANFLDLNAYLITNRVAVAAASSYALTANDEADAVLGCCPRGFRSAPDVTGFARHLNDIGMKGWKMGELIAWAAIGVT